MFSAVSGGFENRLFMPYSRVLRCSLFQVVSRGYCQTLPEVLRFNGIGWGYTSMSGTNDCGEHVERRLIMVDKQRRRIEEQRERVYDREDQRRQAAEERRLDQLDEQRGTIEEQREQVYDREEKRRQKAEERRQAAEERRQEKLEGQRERVEDQRRRARS